MVSVFHFRLVSFGRLLSFLQHGLGHYKMTRSKTKFFKSEVFHREVDLTLATYRKKIRRNIRRMPLKPKMTSTGFRDHRGASAVETSRVPGIKRLHSELPRFWSPERFWLVLVGRSGNPTQKQPFSMGGGFYRRTIG